MKEGIRLIFVVGISISLCDKKFEKTIKYGNNCVKLTIMPTKIRQKTTLNV